MGASEYSLPTLRCLYSFLTGILEFARICLLLLSVVPAYEETSLLWLA